MTEERKKRAAGINKKDLTEKLALKSGIPKIRAAEYIDTLTGIIAEALLDGKKVTISDFGTFNLSERTAFRGYDPRNEKRIHVPRRVIPVFRAGKQLKNALNLPLIKKCTVVGPNQIQIEFSKLLDPKDNDIINKSSYEILLSPGGKCMVLNVIPNTLNEIRKDNKGPKEISGIKSVNITCRQRIYESEFMVRISKSFRDVDGNENEKTMRWPRK